MATKKVAVTAAQARATDIRTRLDSLAENIETIPRLVADAWQDSDWAALRYDTWEEYVTGEFGTHLIKLQRAMRKQWVEQLHAIGMSTREIAPVVNASQKTVSRDMEDDLPESNDSPTEPSTTKPDAIFARYERQTRDFLGMLVRFEWPTDDRKKLADLFRQAAVELEG